MLAVAVVRIEMDPIIYSPKKLTILLGIKSERMQKKKSKERFRRSLGASDDTH
jgi:hypothetical protein